MKVSGGWAKMGGGRGTGGHIFHRGCPIEPPLLREAVCLEHGGELSWKQYVMLLSITNVYILV